MWGSGTIQMSRRIRSMLRCRISTRRNSPFTLNKEYGFCFALPKTWKGFSIVEGEWSGYDDSDSSVKPAQRTGPMISIRNPRWTKEDPWQDIPIMIFTQKLWPDVASDRLIVSAAPYGPGELGRNSRFVFALPPRYEYAFPNGWEEVTKIAWSHPLKACESK